MSKQKVCSFLSLNDTSKCRYMVDASDLDKIEASRNELHNLLSKPQLVGIPVLVLGNKRDLPNSLEEKDMIEKMYLDEFMLFYLYLIDE